MRLRLLSALALTCIALVALGCGRDSDDSGGSSGSISGRISADGSSTVGPFVTSAAERFKEEESGVDVTVGISGTGGGFERFCRGEIDVANASRAIKDEEAAACKEEGIDYLELQVANDGIVLVDEQRQHLGEMPDDGPAQEDLERGLEGRLVEGRRPGSSRTSS